MSFTIPVVDIISLNINIDDKDINDGDFERLAVKIVEAFSEVGFVYLTNHGISAKLVDEVNKESERFFLLPQQVKFQYRRKDDRNNSGWVSTEMESLSSERPGDLKEAFNITTNGPKIWPDQETPKLHHLSEELWRQCEKLSMRLLRLLAKGLAFQNTELLSDQHNLYSENNSTTMRYLFYPPVPQNVKPGQIRCGEHSDYGSLTILFQDDAGGLQVISRNGDWIDAKPIPGAVIINIGELLQRWTTDQLVATKHRVVIPEEELKKKTTRRSLAYFVHPDDDVIITCLDGSNKYDPVSAYDYLASKFSQTY